jgi:hypothetical protein
MESRSPPTAMHTSTIALSVLLATEAEAARQEWETALALEVDGWQLDPIHWPMAAVLLLGLVPMGICDLGRALLAEDQQVSA